MATYAAGPPQTVTWDPGTLSPGADATLDIDLEVQFPAAGQTLNNSAEVTASDAVLVIGLTDGSEIIISDTGSNLLTGGSGNCFIATAAYGSYLEPEVMVLRRFRDKYLLTNEPGRAFVDWYYRNSPEAAARIADNDSARAVVRLLLSPIVYSLKYPLAALLLLLSMAIGIGWGRQLKRVAR